MGISKHIRDTKELLTECGVVVTSVEISKKHLKFFTIINLFRNTKDIAVQRFY